MALPHCPAVTFTQVNDKVCQAIKVAYRQEGWLNLQAGNQFILRVFSARATRLFTTSHWRAGTFLQLVETLKKIIINPEPFV